MTLPREAWPRLKEAFEGARALALDARPAYLAEACNGDEALRHEVELLLAHDDPGASFLETPAMQFGDRLVAKSLEGQSIGPYQVLALIGTGGMGEVYTARDSKLNRIVAIKVLLPALASASRLLPCYLSSVSANSFLALPVTVRPSARLFGMPARR